MRHGRVRPIFGVLSGALAAACIVDSGQTGSPFDDPPRYQGPGTFQPPGSGGGNIGGEDPGNRDENQSHGEPLRAHEGHLVAMGTDALHVIDVRGDSPRLVGELPLRGRFLDVVMGDDFAVVALDEDAAIDSTKIPDESVPARQARLILVDLSRPEEPRRASSVDLPGWIWRLHRVGDALLVFQEVKTQQPLTCGPSGGWPWGPRTEKMLVQAFKKQGDELVLQESVDLPANVPYGYVSEGTYFGVQEDPSTIVRTLHWTTYASDAFGQLASLPIDSLPEAVVRQGDAVVIVESSGAVSFTSLAGGQEPLARLTGLGATAAKFIGEGLVALSSVEGTHLVDVTNLGSPSVRQHLDREVTEVEVSSFGVISLGTLSSGHLVVQLWSVSDSGTLELIDRVETSVPYGLQPGGAPSWRYNPIHEHLLVPSNAYVGEKVETWWLTFSLSESGLSLDGEQRGAKSTRGMLATEGRLFAWFGDELLHSELPSSTDRTPPIETTYLRERKPIARVTVGGAEIQLHEREEDGRFLLRRVDGEGDISELELDHWADALVERAGRVVVVGFRGFAEECEMSRQAGRPPEEVPKGPGGVDNCASHRARGISVVSVDEGLKKESDFSVTSQLDAIGDFRQDAFWGGYFSLPSERLGFAVHHTARCESKAECERLGVKAYRGVASPGCSPGVEDCDALPSTMEIWSGHRTSLRIYVLDGIEGHPTLKLAAETLGRHDLGGESTVDLNFRVVRDEQGIGFPRGEPVYNDQGNSVTNANGDSLVRYYLDRFALVEDDPWVVAQDSINTPGFPIAWVGEEVFSVEPRYVDEETTAATLHRSLIRNGGAFIRESMKIDGSFQEARRHQSHVYIALGPPTWCQEEFEGALLPLRARPGALELGSALTVRNGLGFPFATSGIRGNELWLRGGTVPGAHVVVDISDPMEPKMIRYTTSPAD